MFREKRSQNILVFIGRGIMTMTYQVVILHPEEGYTRGLDAKTVAVDNNDISV